MTDVTPPPAWEGTSSDPNDEQFGDVILPASRDDLDTFDAVILGEPYDGAVIGRRGASEGPAAIRESLAGVKTYHFDQGTVTNLGDLGNVDVPDTGDVATVQEAVSAVAAELHAADTLPIFIGGDNSLTYANAAPLLEAGSVGALSFDAHLDCREVRDEPTSGTPYRQLHEAGLDAFAVVGARHFETSGTYHEYVTSRGGEIVTAEAVRDDPYEAIERAMDAVAGLDALYVSVDVDVLDANAAPGVSAPTPGGITSRELFTMVRHVTASSQLAGFEVVECAPPLDRDGMTTDAATRTIAHALAGVGERR
jgi:formiminoglutamase/agmatinase